MQFVDAEAWYETPTRTIAGYDRVLAQLNGQRAHIIGEVEFGESAADWPAWTRYEAVANQVLQQYDALAVCPYDRRVLPPLLVDGAARTHPYLLEPHGRVTSADFADPCDFVATVTPSVREPQQPPDVELARVLSARPARRAFAQVLRSAGFDDPDATQLITGLNEIVTNSIVHGGGEASVRLWSEPDGAVIAAVQDRGPGITTEFPGFWPPRLDTPNGRGLWLARQIFPRLEIESAPDGGTRVLAWTGIAAGAAPQPNSPR